MAEASVKKLIIAQIKEHKEENRALVRFSDAWHREDAAIEALNRLKETIAKGAK